MRVRSSTPRANRAAALVYFDHNATSPMLPQAREAWLEAATNLIGNPSSTHRIGSRAEHALEQARTRLAEHLDCRPGDILWTSGATEACNTALHHVAQKLPDRTSVWISAVEHPCVLAATRRYFPGQHRLLRVNRHGLLDLEFLRAALKQGPRPGLIAVMAANNETGVLQPWRQICELCHQYRILFLCDATQWLGRLPAAGLGQCDFISGSTHKCGGPKGVGFLKCPRTSSLAPLLVGGGQEHGRRAGTENVPGILSMLRALDAREAALQYRAESVAERTEWRAQFEGALLTNLPGTEIVGGQSDRLWNTVAALMPDLGSPHRWSVQLDKAGFAVSVGSACASGEAKLSHVLAAMGYDAPAADRVLRFSSTWETSLTDWNRLLGAIRATAGLRCRTPRVTRPRPDPPRGVRRQQDRAPENPQR